MIKKIKIVYDNNTDMTEFDELIEFFSYIIQFEKLNKDNPKERKKALMTTSSCGAKVLPFAAVYDPELIKAFYSEVGMNAKQIHEYIMMSMIANSKSGNITIQKIAGVDRPDYPIGDSQYGYTAHFGEGLSCKMDNKDFWFRTSNILSIDWENKTFKTLNSVYKFTFNEDRKNN